MKLLLTGFEPFGGEHINPALEAVMRVADTLGAVEVTKLTVPTVFGKSIAVVQAEMNRLRPDAVLCVGQAGGRFEVTPERVAINLDDARIADNEGNCPLSAPIVADGDTAYFSNLPLRAMVRAIRVAGVPASISNTAGTFVCNHLLYGVLHHIHSACPGVRGGFVHVPFLPEQVVHRPAPTPSMALADIVRALEAAIGAIAAHDRDILEGAEGTEA